MKPKSSTLKEQQLNAELGLIIDELGQAIWKADKKYIARSSSDTPLTFNMSTALYKFKFYCQDHYGK